MKKEWWLEFVEIHELLRISFCLSFTCLMLKLWLFVEIKVIHWFERVWLRIALGFLKSVAKIQQGEAAAFFFPFFPLPRFLSLDYWLSFCTSVSCLREAREG